MKVSTGYWLTISSVAALACGPRKAPLAKEPGWYEIARTPGIVAYLDTARLDRLGEGRARVWFRFAYSKPYTPSNDTSVHYEATETRQELDCLHRQTRGLELRMQATGGVAVGVPAPDTIATSIDTHPLNSGVFLVACRVIGHPIPPHSGT
jgi:surface-adhesin protein E